MAGTAGRPRRLLRAGPGAGRGLRTPARGGPRPAQRAADRAGGRARGPGRPRVAATRPAGAGRAHGRDPGRARCRRQAVAGAGPGRGRVIFHITTEWAWETARRAGIYAADTLDSEGFIHCSTAEQWPRVLEERFPGRDDLTLLE